MQIAIRLMEDRDRGAWATMRAQLWPEAGAPTHTAEMDDMLGRDDVWGFIAETDERNPVGFAEIAIRPYANGCDSRPVPFLEGIWVDPGFRQCGIGGRLIDHIEAFLRARGFTELGSDTEIDNRTSQTAHASWGFCETERVVYFRKRF